MKEILEAVGSVLCAVPCALLTYRTQDGEARILPTDWVGVVCARPALVTVCLRRPFELFGEAMEGGEFAVNLPSTARLATLHPGYGPLEARARLQCAEIISAPLLADCPIRLECRNGTVLHRFNKEVLSAEVAAVHMNGRVYGGDFPPDLYRLRPFAHPLLASRSRSYAGALETAMEGSRRIENSTCF